MKYFEYTENPDGKFFITPIYEKFPEIIRNGSGMLYACRISGLSWPNWLRYCRQNGATLYGKSHKYPVAYWDKPNEDFLKALNKRATELMKKENP